MARSTARRAIPIRPSLHFTEAVQLDPKDAAAHNSLAWLLATGPQERFRDGKRAIDHATRACELTKWKRSAYLDTLAAAYAEAGKFDKAVEFQQKAVELATKDTEKDGLGNASNSIKMASPTGSP